MSRIIHPRRTRKQKMLGQVEDAARLAAREEPGLLNTESIVYETEQRLSWGTLYDGPTTESDTNEVDLAVRAYREEESLREQEDF